jgi:methyl-accepting chemotaxis protein
MTTSIQQVVPEGLPSMKLLSRLGSNLKIGTRVGAGFVLILALLGAVAGLGYLALSNAERSTTQLGTFALNMARLGVIDAQFAQLRRSVLIVANTGSEEAEKDARNHLRIINETAAQASFTNPERRKRLEQIVSKVKEYTVVFENIVKKRAEQRQTVEVILRPMGNQLQNALADLVQSALAQNDTTIAAYAGEAETNFLKTRLNMTQYVAAPSQTNLAKAAEEFDAKVVPALNRLRQVVRTPELQARVQELIPLAEKYSKARPISVSSVVEVNRLTNTVGAAIADQVRDELNELNKMQVDAVEATRSDTLALLASALLTSIWVAGIAIVIGTLLAWLIGRGISKPLGGLVGGLQRMAKGEDIEIAGVERKDEVGATARAVNEIKVMLAEKARQEAEAKSEQDRKANAERQKAEREKAEQERRAAEEKAENERVASEEKHKREQAAAAEKAEAEKRSQAEREAATARVMSEFDAAVGGIVRAAMAGDFSQRVPLEGKDGVLRNLASALNTMCDTLGKAFDDVGHMLGALSEGDLTQRITAEYQGAFATLKDNANKTAERIGTTVGEIKRSANEVTNASAEISTSTTDLSQRTEEQAASLEETSASMEEIASTVKKNAENAQQANGSAANARDVASRGGEVVAKAVEAMGQIEGSSRKISDIIGVIDEIARQTNLLALNAAVEAARAGEAGRGFAVVASEVRNLAQRSSQAAKDIKDLITNSNGQVQDGVELVNKAGTALSEIVDSINQVATIVADIANASSEQATGIEQVNKALTQMDEVTQQNSALVEENAATAKTLDEQARAMGERVAFFRLADDAPQAMRAAGGAPARQPAQKAAPRPQSVPAAKAPPPKRAVANGGPVGRMQAALATAVNADPDWKEF